MFLPHLGLMITQLSFLQELFDLGTKQIITGSLSRGCPVNLLTAHRADVSKSNGVFRCWPPFIPNGILNSFFAKRYWWKTPPTETNLPNRTCLHRWNTKLVFFSAIIPLDLPKPWGWKDELIFNVTPNLENNVCMKLARYFGSLSQITSFDRPWSLTTPSMKYRAKSIAVIDSSTGMKFTVFENRSTNTRMEFLCRLVVGRLFMKSIDIDD